VLGQHNQYGARNTFILPSGSAGRTPTITQLDAHLAYEHALTKAVKLSVYGDVINLANQRAVVNVDDEYTFSVVNPIAGGKIEDLASLRTRAVHDGNDWVINGQKSWITWGADAHYAMVFARTLPVSSVSV
jgi:hypothetical protein